MNFITTLILSLTTFLSGISPLVPNFTEGMTGQPRSFLPSQVETKSDETISSLIYRSLFRYDIYGSLVPDLVDTWEISDDALVYTVKLKENQYWSNGKPITSDDLIYTSFKVQNLSGVATDKVDDHTVRFTLPNKYSPFLSLLTVGIMPENAEEEMDPLNPVSSGPFKIIRVERNGPVIKQVSLLHEDPNMNIRRLSFRFYANEDELVTAAKLGEIDAFLSSKQRELDNFYVYKYPLQGVYYSLFFNLREEKLQDTELRQNLEKALPLDKLTFDLGISVQGPISRNTFTDRALDFDKYDEDVIADYSDISVTIVVPDIRAHERLADAIENLWEDKFDISVNVDTVDPDQIFSDIIEPRNFEILLYGQEIGRDPDRYVNWHSTQTASPGLNLSGFEQVRADRALEEGRNEPDSLQRTIHYNEFQKVVYEEVPAIFLYHPFANYYVSKYVQGIGEKYTFTLKDRFLDFSNWSRVKTN